MTEKVVEIENGPIMNMDVVDLYNTVIAAASFFFAYTGARSGESWEDVQKFIVETLQSSTSRMEAN